MKPIIALTILLLVLSDSLYAQKLKKRTVVTGILKEVYYEDKTTGMQHGPTFSLDGTTGDTLTLGHYKNGLRDSLWTFFDNGKKQLEYNFTTDSLIFVSNEMLSDSFLIQSGNEFIYDKVDRPLLFIGNKVEIISTLASKLHLPINMMEKGINGSLIIGFRFDEKGSIIGSSKIQALNPEMEQQVNVAMNSLNGRFLPAIYNGKPVPSLIYVKINVLPTGLKSCIQKEEIPYLFEFELYYASGITRTFNGSFTVRKGEL